MRAACKINCCRFTVPNNARDFITSSFVTLGQDPIFIGCFRKFGDGGKLKHDQFRVRSQIEYGSFDKLRLRAMLAERNVLKIIEFDNL